MKKYLTILFSLIFIISLTFPFFANAAVTITTVNLTSTSVSLTVTGLTPKKNYSLGIVAEGNTPSYKPALPFTAGTSGTAKYSFTGLTPSGKYSGVIMDSIIGKVGFVSFTTLPFDGANKVTVTASDIKETSVSLSITGLLANTQAVIHVKNDTSSNSTYDQTKTITSSTLGIGSTSFIGLTSGEKYTVDVKEKNFSVANIKFTSYISSVLAQKWGYTNQGLKTLVTFDTEPSCKNAAVLITPTPACVKNPTLYLDANGIGLYYFTATTNGTTIVLPYYQTKPICDSEKLIYQQANTSATVSDCIQLAQGDLYHVDPITTPPADDGTYHLLAPIPGLGQITATTNIGDYFNIIFKIAIGLCAVLAVVMIVLGGIQYMGDESVFGKTEAKSQIGKAILGLLIAIGSYALLNTINPAMLGTNGVNIAQVSAEIQDETETAPWEGSSFGDATNLCPEGFENIDVPWGVGTKNKLNVCKTIKPQVVAMLNAAKSAGIILSGSGARTKAEQQALRVAHGCPDVNASSKTCSPETAQPGKSMHESGYAIDFRCDDKKMNTSDSCFTWLTDNAGKSEYGGFKKLPSEAWHWSAGPKAGH